MPKQNLSIKTGNIFGLGEHRLLCGDATSSGQIERLISGEKIKAIVTDPPYGVDYVAGKRDLGRIPSANKVIKNDNFQSEEEYRVFTRDWLEAVKHYLETKNSFYVFNSDKMLYSLRDGVLDAGFKAAQLLIWVKSQPIIGRLDYMPQHELILYGWFGRHEFLKSKDRSVLFHPKPNKSSLHPTMKPIGLLRRLILNSTRIGDFIYDPFGGSGSTLVACEQVKRKCLMAEIDPKYCQVIIKRWEKLSKSKAKKQGGSSHE